MLFPNTKPPQTTNAECCGSVLLFFFVFLDFSQFDIYGEVLILFLVARTYNKHTLICILKGFQKKRYIWFKVHAWRFIFTIKFQSAPRVWLILFDQQNYVLSEFMVYSEVDRSIAHFLTLKLSTKSLYIFKNPPR